MIRRAGMIFLAAVFTGSGFAAQLTLPSVFSDHMIFQREQSVPVWGWADAGADITVEFAGQTKTAVASENGKWQVALDPMPASSESRVLEISSVFQSETNSLQFSDVLVGEVWLCSGQSNMGFQFQNSENWSTDAARADSVEIRLYETPQVAATNPVLIQVARTDNPVHNEEAYWKVSSSVSSEYFSAVAMYFGLKLHDDLDVPIGLIDASVGGSSIEAWTAPEGFASVDSLSGYYNISQNMPELSGDLSDDNDVVTALYNGMIAGHIPFAMRGVIWYQGESNRDDGTFYIDKTRALLNGWRELWGEDFPCYFVQIAPYQYNQQALQVLPVFWEAQSEIVDQIPGTGMAVINDAATLDNIHPPYKKIPGERLALLAEANTYGMSVVSTGPVFQTLEKTAGSLTVNFSSADGLTTRDGQSPDWFEIVGMDGTYKPAQAVIQGSSVVLSSPDVSNPVAMRFAWDELAEPNLMNGAGLPASAFRAGETDIANMLETKTVSDSFDRDVAAQTSASVPNLIGTNYTIVSGSWSCNSASPGFLNAGADGFMIDTSLQTLSSGGNNFTVSAKGLVGSAGFHPAGLVFNYHDENNYCVLRFWAETDRTQSMIQLVEYTGGSSHVLGYQITTLEVGTYYTMTVSSSGSTLNWSFIDSDGSTVLYSDSATGSYSDGYAGFYRLGGKTCRFDDYSLSVISPPVPDADAADSFDRTVAAQTSASSPNLIGTNYTILSGEWSCNSAAPGFLNASADGIMLDTSLETVNTGGTNFVVSVKAMAGSSGFHPPGLVFNWQDADNYSVLRFYVEADRSESVVQVLDITDGSTAVLGQCITNLEVATYYTITVSSFGNALNWSFSDAGTVICSGWYPSISKTNGYAGFYRLGGKTCRFDDYSLKLYYPEPAFAPEPAAMRFSLTAGGVAINVDNLSDSSSVTNILQTRTNLLSGTWTDLYSVTGATATNWTLPVDGNQCFFRVLTTY